ncbi:MAG: ORF6N domain-containing protein [Spirochaetes bacterium]|nr:ORF6N domain-containing protein [Spirochaetota bacterium]
MIDKDLAKIYGIETRVLKQAVKRNIKRFLEDFMFELTDLEMDLMVSQFVIPSKRCFGGTTPFVFTEQGVAGLSGVLTSNKAIEINIKIMRAFVALRKFITNNAVLFQRLDKVEQK